MPERKVKAIGRARAGLVLVIPALAAALALTACLPAATRHSARPPQQVQPPPMTTAQPALAGAPIYLSTSPLAPYGLTDPIQPVQPMAPPALAGAPLPMTTLEPYGLTDPVQPIQPTAPPALAEAPLTETPWPAAEALTVAATTIAPLRTEQTPLTMEQAPGEPLARAVTQTEVIPRAEASLMAQTGPDQTALHSRQPSLSYQTGLSYQPGPPPQSFVFSSGLIDQARLLAEPFPGRILTAQAGERLLIAFGLTPTRDDDPEEQDTEPLPGLEAAPVMTLAALNPAAALDSAIAAPAPSAGVPSISLSAGKSRHKGDRTTKLLTAAYEQTGRHYKLGGLNPGAGFDAAGYTHWVFSREGLSLPRTPSGLASAGIAVARENLRPGDVLIYRNPTDKVNGWHVGIYSGQGNFLHASPKAGVVTETDAFGPQYAPYFLGGRRFYDDPEAAPLSDSQKMAATSTAVKLALAELGPNDKVAKPKPAPKAAKPKAKKAAKK